MRPVGKEDRRCLTYAQAAHGCGGVLVLVSSRPSTSFFEAILRIVFGFTCASRLCQVARLVDSDDMKAPSDGWSDGFLGLMAKRYRVLPTLSPTMVTSLSLDVNCTWDPAKVTVQPISVTAAIDRRFLPSPGT